jgi:hypothetical protein
MGEMESFKLLKSNRASTEFMLSEAEALSMTRFMFLLYDLIREPF